jgi:hypothetical protein
MRGFLRPKATVLPATALVPEANLVQPPKQLTHQVQAAQPYFYAVPPSHAAADGQFAAGTCVVLRDEISDTWCQVVDANGLSVVTARGGLVQLHSPHK